jgi:hypothetical protein
MDLAVLKAKRAKLKIQYDGEDVNFEIYPHKLTPEYRAQLQKLAREASEPESRDADAVMVADLLSSWDVLLDSQPFPPTYENLQQIPVALLATIAAEILVFVGKLAMPESSS